MNSTDIRTHKVEAVADLKAKLGRAKAVILADNLGLSVLNATRLRREFRKAGVEFKVAKNTLIRIALRELGVEGADSFLSGPTTLTFSYDDHITGAKKLQEFFARDRNPKLVVKAGILEGRVIDAEGVKSLADMPPREVLLAQVLAGIEAPMTGFAAALNALLGSFAWALDARVQQLTETEV